MGLGDVSNNSDFHPHLLDNVYFKIKLNLNYCCAFLLPLWPRDVSNPCFTRVTFSSIHWTLDVVLYHWSNFSQHPLLVKSISYLNMCFFHGPYVARPWFCKLSHNSDLNQHPGGRDPWRLLNEPKVELFLSSLLWECFWHISHEWGLEPQCTDHFWLLALKTSLLNVHRVEISLAMATPEFTAFVYETVWEWMQNLWPEHG